MELSAKNFLYTILLNKDTEKIADAYILGYLEKHPHIVDEFFKMRPIYVLHVYALFNGDVDIENAEAIINLFYSREEAIDEILLYLSDELVLSDTDSSDTDSSKEEEYTSQNIIDWFTKYDEGDFYESRFIITKKYIN